MVFSKRRFVSLLFFLLLTLSSALGSVDYTVETVPNPKNGGNGYVSDPDGYLSVNEISAINGLLANLEDSSTAQVAVVLLESIGQENPKDFATRLFNHWGIGQADVDNGLLILSVMNQRRTEFETGYGLEAVLPDVICYRIGMQQLVPYFKNEQYGPGLIAAIMEIKLLLENPEVIEEIWSDSPKRPRSEAWGPLGALPAGLRWYIMIAFLLHVGLISWIVLTLFGKGDLYDKYIHLRNVRLIPLLILFPLPYILVYIYLRRKLKELRHQPRFSKVNGKPMTLLAEYEEDDFLERGQITEEEIGSADYDVWVTDNGDDILILRYSKFQFKYKKCPSCSYTTYHRARSRVIRAATYSSSGLRKDTYECKSCAYTVTKSVTIPQKTRSSSGGSSGGGGGGGGGSWGGGSSGGGGAGVSW